MVKRRKAHHPSTTSKGLLDELKDVCGELRLHITGRLAEFQAFKGARVSVRAIDFIESYVDVAIQVFEWQGCMLL